jgi:hypothetical protein
MRTLNGGRTAVEPRVLLFLASLLPWEQQAETAAQWSAAARSARPAQRRSLVLRALAAVVAADRRGPSDPALAVVVALGRLRLVSALLACASLVLAAVAVHWVVGDAPVLAIMGGAVGLGFAGPAFFLLTQTVAVLKRRAGWLTGFSALSLAVLSISSVMSALAPSSATAVAALSACAVGVCSLMALAWSAHLGAVRGDHGSSVRAAPLTLGLALVAAGCVVAAAVVRPLLAAPGMTLDAFYAAVDAIGLGTSTRSTYALWIGLLAVTLLVTHVVVAVGLRRNTLRPSSARALIAGAAVAVVMSEALASTATMWAITDTEVVTASDGSVTVVLGVLGVCLTVFALLEGARHPYASPRVPPPAVAV